MKKAINGTERGVLKMFCTMAMSLELNISSPQVTMLKGITFT